MVNLCGSGYVMDYCIAALLHDMERKRDEAMYVNYIADCLKVLTENTAKSVQPGQSGNYISNRLADIISPTPKEPERSGEEIAIDIIRKAGLRTKSEGEEVNKEE